MRALLCVSTLLIIALIVVVSQRLLAPSRQDVAQTETEEEYWRLEAWSNLDRFKAVCDDATLTEEHTQAWLRRTADTGHATAMAQWAAQARERIKMFQRNPEWAAACRKAWAMPGPEPVTRPRR